MQVTHGASGLPGQAFLPVAAADSLTPEKLLELIRDERADSALYAHLACRMKGKAQAMLREMARQEACHAKQFGAVYFLKTGKKACPGRPDAGAAGAGLLVHLGSRDSLRIHHAAPDPLRLLFCEWLHGISLLRPIVCAAGPDCAVSQKIPHGNGKFARFSHRKILYFQYVCVKILFCEIFMYETFRQRRKGRQV